MCNKEYTKKLIDRLDEILFDSIVFIFGISKGEYLQELEKKLCIENRVVIIEPNEEVYNTYKDLIKDNRINLVLFDDKTIETIIGKLVNYEKFDRLLVHPYGNYKEEYSKEYERFIEILDSVYLTVSSGLGVANSFKSLFLENLTSNIYKINNSTPLNSYIDSNKNIPAIIVSAGPSLDKNIQTMMKYKNYLDKIFIIAGNRTLGSLLKNNIVPDLVVSIDPQHVTCEMIEQYIDYEIPLAFYEFSNKNLINKYKGELIYLAELLPKTIETMKNFMGTFSGGSVAHSSTDIARIMGCNPIIFVGQDLAYTFEKDHSEISAFPIDKQKSEHNFIYTKDINNNDIKTTITLDFYKMKFEQYIKFIQSSEDVKFYNASYGADIKGAPHVELEEIIKTLELEKASHKLNPNKCINIDSQHIVDSINDHVNTYLEKCDECINICKRLIQSNIDIPMTQMKEDSKDLKDFIYVIDTVTNFESNMNTYYIGAYIKCFIYYIRNKYFEMKAKDYTNLTSNLNYQSNCFLNYFKELKEILKEIKEILIKEE